MAIKFRLCFILKQTQAAPQKGAAVLAINPLK